MNIKYLQWDSDFFNKKIGELSPNEAINVPFNLTQDYDLIIIKQIKDFSCEIDGYEKTFEETKVLFEKKLTFDNINEIVIEDTDFQNKPPEDFYDLAYESGKYSRFKLDLNLKNKFQDIYKKWVDNSLNKTFAEKVFYIHSEETIDLSHCKEMETLQKLDLLPLIQIFKEKELEQNCFKQQNIMPSKTIWTKC